MEKTYIEIKKEFVNKYTTAILPVLRENEEERKKKRKLVLIIRILSIIVMILNILFLSPVSGFEELVKFINAIAFAVLLSCGYVVKKHFENKIKEKIMPAVCSCFGDLKWSCGIFLSSPVIKESRLIPHYTSSSFDDVFNGSWKDVSFEIIEAHYTRRSDKHDVTVFKGVIIRLSMNKAFSAHTVITADSLLHSSPAQNLKHTELEDVVFEKKFDVFTNDPIEARYLITPSFMERINNISEVFKLKLYSISFFQNNLFIAFKSSKDLFSLAALNGSLLDTGEIATLFDEIISIYKLIDYFKLNQKTGL